MYLPPPNADSWDMGANIRHFIGKSFEGGGMVIQSTINSKPCWIVVVTGWERRSPPSRRDEKPCLIPARWTKHPNNYMVHAVETTKISRNRMQAVPLSTNPGQPTMYCEKTAIMLKVNWRTFVRNWVGDILEKVAVWTLFCVSMDEQMNCILYVREPGVPSLETCAANYHRLHWGYYGYSLSTFRLL